MNLRKMANRQIKIATFLILLLSCSEEQPANLDKIDLNDSLSYEDMLGGIHSDLLTQTVELPDADGALSRNKDGYFSVRFQINITRLSDLAIVEQRTDALTEYLHALRYAFNYQNQDGSYQLSPPDDLINNSEVGLPTKGDSVSAVAFFGYALGISLNALTASSWYQTDDQVLPLKKDLESVTPNVEATLNYLIEHESLLKQVDAAAPNRLLFNAIAFYGLGKYLSDHFAQQIGLEFLDLALNQVNEEQGYFIEGGGWDSSYNGVAIKLGFEMYTIISAESQARQPLEKVLIGATKWQASRVLQSGEILTDGNTRVYPGGEAFLGNEKDVDAEKTIRAFYYFSKLSGKPEYKELADRVLEYYR